MKKNLPAVSSSAAAGTRLKAMQGPYKGAVYKLLAGKITIGRSSSNDICLAKDEKCSRKQALVTISPQGASIKDLSKRSSLKINNMARIQSALQDGDVIQFGASSFQFEHKAPAGAAIAAPAGGPAPLEGGGAALKPVDADDLQVGLPVDLPVGVPGGVPSSPRGRGVQKPKKNNKPKILIALAVLIVIGFLMSDQNPAGDDNKNKLAAVKDMEKNIQTLKELRKKEEKKLNKQFAPYFKNAQAAYIKGVRDYRKGFYARAIEAFRVCKTLYPQHELCANYLQKAQIKQQQLIQAWMIAGKDYREKRRFSACMAAFKNVTLAVPDENNMIYKEAQANYDICRFQYKGRY